MDKKLIITSLFLFCLFISSRASAYTANYAQFEFLNSPSNSGRYRVHVFYTVPALREFRQAYVDFTKKTEAEKFYFDLLKGADFYYPDPKLTQFVNKPLKAEPW